MSFLLDALRKSEKQKHLGQAPTIHSSSIPDQHRWANRRLGLLLVLLLPVLLVLAWSGLKDFFQGVTNQPQQPRSPVVVGQQVPPAQPGQAADTDRKALPEIPVHAASNGQQSAARTPVESYVEPLPDPDLVTTQQAEPYNGPAVIEQASVQDEGESAGQFALPGETNQAPAQPTRQEFALISYWELPPSVRAQLMEMRITVMVYSDTPEDRFILMSGRRLVAGDEPQSGLVLEEIRRDGAVFSFRLYRFLVKQ